MLFKRTGIDPGNNIGTRSIMAHLDHCSSLPTGPLSLPFAPQRPLSALQPQGSYPIAPMTSSSVTPHLSHSQIPILILQGWSGPVPMASLASSLPLSSPPTHSAPATLVIAAARSHQVCSFCSLCSNAPLSQRGSLISLQKEHSLLYPHHSLPSKTHNLAEYSPFCYRRSPSEKARYFSVFCLQLFPHTKNQACRDLINIQPGNESPISCSCQAHSH